VRPTRFRVRIQPYRVSAKCCAVGDGREVARLGLSLERLIVLKVGGLGVCRENSLSLRNLGARRVLWLNLPRKTAHRGAAENADNAESSFPEDSPGEAFPRKSPSLIQIARDTVGGKTGGQHLPALATSSSIRVA
jgi:hypothetical protein